MIDETMARQYHDWPTKTVTSDCIRLIFTTKKHLCSKTRSFKA